MAKFNDLIKEDPQKAAGIIQDAFLHIVNTMIPEIYLTKEEWHTVSKIIFSGQAQLNIKHPEYRLGVRKNNVPDAWALLVIDKNELDLLLLINY